jgi:hypothetical protein
MKTIELSYANGTLVITNDPKLNDPTLMSDKIPTELYDLVKHNVINGTPILNKLSYAIRGDIYKVTFIAPKEDYDFTKLMGASCCIT